MGLNLKVVDQICLKHTMLAFEEQQQNISAHAAFVDVFNKELPIFLSPRMVSIFKTLMNIIATLN